MELRRRNASQIASLAEMAAGSDNDDPVEAQPTSKPLSLPADSESDEEYGVKPSKPKRRAPARRKPAAGPIRPDLVELVIRDMGRKDLFSRATLVALRRTSRGFKAMLDGLFSSLSSVTIHHKDGLTQLMKNPSTIQTMETFSYLGSRALEVSPVVALMVANPSQLKKLVLQKAGMAFDILVHASLPNLTSLKVSGLDKKSKALEWLSYRERESAWPLQELELHGERAVAHTVLVPVLRSFQQLRKLTLSDNILDSRGRLDHEGLVEDSFPELETLNLNMRDPGRLGLLNHARLPALLHLDVQYAHFYSNSGQPLVRSLDAPWVQQLQSLTLNSDIRRKVFPGDVSVLSAFHSDALQKLVIHSWQEQDALFESANLQGLTNLEVRMRYAGSSSIPRGVMAALAAASIPQLSKLTVMGDHRYTLEDGDIHSLGAFKQLRSLSISSLCMQESDWGWFLTNILPRLEDFKFWDDGKLIRSIRAMNPLVASWPLLQKLTLEAYPLLNILPLAPHFPGITALRVGNFRVREHSDGPQAGQEAAHEAILNAAFNDCAWPNLESLSFNEWGWYLNGDDLTILERAWPKAGIIRR